MPCEGLPFELEPYAKNQAGVMLALAMVSTIQQSHFRFSHVAETSFHSQSVGPTTMEAFAEELHRGCPDLRRGRPQSLQRASHMATGTDALQEHFI